MICLKFPIRARAQKFLDMLMMYKSTCSKPSNVQLIISMDEDDKEMTDEVCQKALSIFPNTLLFKNKPAGKIAACNANLDAIDERVKIIVLASDDMFPQVMGWDDTLNEEMEKYYPDCDGVLFHSDGYIGQRLNCMCILGITYFKRFGYLYHPDYKSLWCDNEFHEVADSLGKQKYFELCLFKHQHYARNPKVKMDELMKHNESFYSSDAKIFSERKQQGFPINSIF